jgi:hypothetical protein
VERQLQVAGDGTGDAEGHERVEGLVTTGGQPAGTGRRVLGEGQAAPARGLGGPGDVGGRAGVEQVTVGAIEFRLRVQEPHLTPWCSGGTGCRLARTVAHCRQLA